MPFIEIDPTTAEEISATTQGDPLTDEGTSFAAFVIELEALLAGREDVETDRMKTWVNEAYRDFSGSELIAELDAFKGSTSFDLVEDQPFYLLPPEVRAIRAPGLCIIDTVNFPDAGGRPLEKIDLARYRMLPDLSTRTDKLPTKFFRERRVIVVWPTPDLVKTMTLDFWIKPNDLVGDTDCPMFPVEYHEGLKLLAKAKALT